MRRTQTFSGWIALVLTLGCQTAPQRQNHSPISTTRQLILEVVGHEQQAWDVTVHHRHPASDAAHAAIVEQIHIVVSSGRGYEQPFRIPVQNRVERIVVRRVTVRKPIEPCVDRFCGHILVLSATDPWERYLSDSDNGTEEQIFLENTSDQAATSAVELQSVN